MISPLPSRFNRIEGFLRQVLGSVTKAGYAHSDFHRLLIIQPWIDCRLIGPGEISVCEPSCSACAFRNVFARQLQVYAAQVATKTLVYAKCRLQLGGPVGLPARP